MKHLIRLVLAALGCTHISYEGSARQWHFHNRNGVRTSLSNHRPLHIYMVLCRIAGIHSVQFYNRHYGRR